MKKIYSALATLALMASMPSLAANLAELSLSPKTPTKDHNDGDSKIVRQVDKVIKETRQIEKCPPTCDGDI